MITEKISNSGILSGTINTSSNLTMGVGSSNNLVGGNINTFTKETDPTIPDYIKAISKEDIAGWDNNAVVNEEQNKTLVGLEELIDTITPKAPPVKGELVHVTDALPLPTFENKVDGNVKQETTKGNQLLDINTIRVTDGTISNGIITSNILANWGAITWRFPIMALSRTIYYISFDLRIKSGTCKQLNKLNMWDSNGAWVESYDFIAKPTPSNIYQRYCLKFDLTDNTTLYNLNGINIQVGGNVIDAILEVKDIMLSTSSDYTYEKFTNGASPNPEYPQEIEVLEGYNLWDFENQKFAVGARCIVEQTKDYIKLTATETGYASAVSNITLDAGDYIFDTFAGTNNYTSNFVTLKDGNTIGTSQLNGARVISLTEKAEITLRLYISNANVGDSITITKIFVIKRNFKTQSTYMPYNHIGIEVCGKNKAKSIVNIPSTSQFIATLFIDTNYIKPSTTYTIGFVAPKDCKMYFNENLFKYMAITGTGKFETYTITTLDNIDFNQYFVSRGWSVLKTNSGNTIESVITDAMLVEGVVNDLTYEPHKEQVVPLDLKGNWIGKINDNIKDYLVTDKKKF